MGAKKILSYGRYILVTLLVVYLILVWMYFKDNAGQLTSASLLLWFVVIPLTLFGSIMVIRWGQKRIENKATDTPSITNDEETTELPDAYRLFVYSRICLPEGDCWSDVIDNAEEVTALSEDLTDFDGLPILTRPILGLSDTASLPYTYGSDTSLVDAGFDAYSLNHDDDDIDGADAHTKDISDQNSITQRLCALIHEQLSLSDDILSTLAEHFNQYHQPAAEPPNSAIHIHPEWQQHYLVSADKENKDDTISAAHVSISKLSVYLCIPASADLALLIHVIKEHLTTYGIDTALVTITPIIIGQTDQENDHSPSCPAVFIDETLTALSQAAVPELCLLIIADSEMNEEWLDVQLYSAPMSTDVVPTEAGILLAFFNQAAQDTLGLDTTASITFTKIATPETKDSSIKNSNANTTDTHNYRAADDYSHSRRHYLHQLTMIKNLLIDNDLSLTPLHSAISNTTNKPTTKLPDTHSRTKVALSDISITAISDINPAAQPYDMAVFMGFVDAFIAQGALVNEHHLGHYMPLNNWLKPFIGLSLLADLVAKDQQESDSVFLITQHEHCSMLWLTDFSQTPSS